MPRVSTPDASLLALPFGDQPPSNEDGGGWSGLGERRAELGRVREQSVRVRGAEGGVGATDVHARGYRATCRGLLLRAHPLTLLRDDRARA